MSSSGCNEIKDECSAIYGINYIPNTFNTYFKSELVKYNDTVKGNINDIPYYTSVICYKSYQEIRGNCGENNIKPKLCKEICDFFNKKFKQYSEVFEDSVICSLSENDDCFKGTETEMKYN
eukprot:jgi/Orpsp1_1/1190246/evm.model.d7180000077705.1